MMVIPFIVFWVLLYFARDDLGIKGIAIAVLVWSCLLAGMLLLGISPLYFVAIQAAIDIALILFVYGEDITIG